MEKTLVGFKRFNSKSGKPCCVAVINRPFTEAEMSRGSCGMSAEEIFLPAEQYDYLGVNDIGKPVTTTYDIVGGRAYLRELTVIRK